MKKGNDLILSLNGTRLAASKACSIDRKTDTIEVCSPTDGAARRYKPSTTDWSVSASGLYANRAGAERLRDIWRKYQAGQPTALTISIVDEGVAETGEVILADLKEQGDHNSLVKFSIKLQGSGPLVGPQYADLESWSGGDEKVMTYDEYILNIYRDEDYELLTYENDHEAYDRRVRLIGKCTWFLFDTDKTFVRLCIDRYDSSIEQSLIDEGTEKSVAVVGAQRNTLVVCHRKGSPIVALIE